jgi:flavin reductase (DIM6/NTAB) family NADH-FMN oxidoreductase RutF
MRKEVEFFDVYHETLDKLEGDGILLVAGDPPNPMTIGWGTLGHIWNKQIMTVLVRPTRHTFSLMESVKDFSVCVLTDQFRKQLNICGTKSGRDINKIEACHFTMEHGFKTESFFIAESTIHFECRIVHKHLLDSSTLEPGIIKRYYPLKDFHMVYYGEILGVFRNDQ